MNIKQDVHYAIKIKPFWLKDGVVDIPEIGLKNQVWAFVTDGYDLTDPVVEYNKDMLKIDGLNSISKQIDISAGGDFAFMQSTKFSLVNLDKFGNPLHSTILNMNDTIILGGSVVEYYVIINDVKTLIGTFRLDSFDFTDEEFTINLIDIHKNDDDVVVGGAFGNIKKLPLVDENSVNKSDIILYSCPITRLEIADDSDVYSVLEGSFYDVAGTTKEHIVAGNFHYLLRIQYDLDSLDIVNNSQFVEINDKYLTILEVTNDTDYINIKITGDLGLEDVANMFGNWEDVTDANLRDDLSSFDGSIVKFGKYAVKLDSNIDVDDIITIVDENGNEIDKSLLIEVDGVWYLPAQAVSKKVIDIPSNEVKWYSDTSWEPLAITDSDFTNTLSGAINNTADNKATIFRINTSGYYNNIASYNNVYLGVEVKPYLLEVNATTTWAYYQFRNFYDDCDDNNIGYNTDNDWTCLWNGRLFGWSNEDEEDHWCHPEYNQTSWDNLPTYTKYDNSSHSFYVSSNNNIYTNFLLTDYYSFDVLPVVNDKKYGYVRNTAGEIQEQKIPILRKSTSLTRPATNYEYTESDSDRYDGVNELTAGSYNVVLEDTGNMNNVRYSVHQFSDYGSDGDGIYDVIKYKSEEIKVNIKDQIETSPTLVIVAGMRSLTEKLMRLSFIRERKDTIGTDNWKQKSTTYEMEIDNDSAGKGADPVIFEQCRSWLKDTTDIGLAVADLKFYLVGEDVTDVVGGDKLFAQFKNEDTNTFDKLLSNLTNTAVSFFSHWNCGNYEKEPKNRWNIVTDLCKQSFLAGWSDVNGTPKFKEVGVWGLDAEPIIFSTTNVLNNKFSKLTQTQQSRVYNEYVLNFNYEGDTAQSQIIIQNVDADTYDSSFVVGISDSSFAERVWQKCHDSYMQNRVINKLPSDRANLKYAITKNFFYDTEEFDNTEEWAYELVEMLATWTGYRKFTLSVSVPLTYDNIQHDLMKDCIIRDDIITPNGAEGRGWITKIVLNPKKYTIDYTITLNTDFLAGYIPTYCGDIYEGREGAIDIIESDTPTDEIIEGEC